MPRRMQDIVRLRAPFGGLNTVAARRNVHPLDGTAAANVHTAYGDIMLREPFVLWGPVLGTHPLSNLAPHGGMLLQRISLTLSPESATYRQDKEYLLVHCVREDGQRTYRRVQLVGPWAIECQFDYEAPDHLPGDVTAAVGMNRLFIGSREANPAPGFFKKLAFDMATGWVSWRVFPARPTVMPTLTKVSGGSMTAGGWYYRYTYYNSRHDVETNGGPQRELVLTSGDIAGGIRSIRVACTLSTDPQIDKIRIYRYPSAGGYYRITEINNSGTGEWLDDGSTAPDTNWDKQVPTGLYDEFAAGLRAMCWHQNRMWYAPATGHIYHSELYRPEMVYATNEYGVGGPDGDPVQCMVSLGGQMLIFKRNALWALSGSGPDSYVTELVQRGIGCCAPRAVAMVGDSLYVANAAGIWQLGEREPISGPVQALWRNEADLDYVTMAFDERHRLLVINVPRTDSTARQYVFCPGTGKWSVWTVPIGCIAAVGGRLDSETGSPGANVATLYGWPLVAPNAFLGDSNSMQLDPNVFGGQWGASSGVPVPPGNTIGGEGGGGGNSSDFRVVRQWPVNPPFGDWTGAGIFWTWTTPVLDLGLLQPKRFFYFALCAERAAVGPQPIVVERSLDETDLQQFGSTDLAESGESLLRLACTARTLQVRVRGEATAPVRLIGFDIDAEPAGRR